MDLGYSLGLSARVAARRHDTEAVSDLITRLAGEIVEAGPKRRDGFTDAWHGALVAASRSGLSAGEFEVLRGLLADPPQPVGHQGDPGWPAHLSGAIAELENDVAAAITHYGDAVTQGKGRSIPAHADALLGLARSQMAAGENAAALGTAQEARKVLDHFVGWRRDEADALVRRLSSPGSPTRIGDLTAREVEVAALVAEGLSNGEIGRRLYISTKTASVHVSSILRKLDMTSRSEIAAWAVRNRIGPLDQ